jgi:ubiquinone/menaquinone biosynthesis C-methylase UbiE
VNTGLRILLYIVLTILALPLVLYTVARIVRAFYRFPMPQFAANLIDNPLRRRIQPPDETALRHGLEAGMTVLEVGPGNGTYTLAAARRVGQQGHVVAIDIEPRMIERVQRRIEAEGVTNIEVRVADVYDLPFDDGTFDAIYMIAVIGEIPEPARAMQEFHRVLSPTGTLAFSELLWDPDYPRASTLVRMGTASGFRLQRKLGRTIHYTLIFGKGS